MKTAAEQLAYLLPQTLGLAPRPGAGMKTLLSIS